MIPETFEYQRAATVEDALRMLSEDADAKLLAGGHSLLPLMKMRLATPNRLVDLSGLRELHGVRREGQQIVVGTMTTHREVATDPEIRASLPALTEAASQIGDIQVRNRGTIGGNLAHADPASDLPAVALCYGATLTVAGAEGEETLGTDDFFVGPLMTALPEGALVLSVSFPVPEAGTRSAYEKYPHPASGYAVVGVAASAKLGDDGRIERVRIGVTGAGDMAYRATAVEEKLLGQRPDEDLIAEAAALADEDGMMGEDLFASEEYRRHLCHVFTRRALRRVLL